MTRPLILAVVAVIVAAFGLGVLVAMGDTR